MASLRASGSDLQFGTKQKIEKRCSCMTMSHVRCIAKVGTCPIVEENDDTSPEATDQAASLTSIVLDSGGAGLRIVIFRTPFDMVARITRLRARRLPRRSSQ